MEKTKSVIGYALLQKQTQMNSEQQNTEETKNEVPFFFFLSLKKKILQ